MRTFDNQQGEIRIRYEFPLPLQDHPIPYKLISKLLINACNEARLITQAPEGMICMTAISAISQVLQGVIDVKLPTGNIKPVSIMTMLIAESGERKSTVENLFKKGIKSFEKLELKTYQESLNRYKIELDFHKSKTSQISKIKNLDNEGESDEVVKKLLEHHSHQPIKPVRSMLTFEDSTPEALFSDLSQNIPNAFLGSSEGGILLNSRVMSQSASLNSIWSGDEITVNRKSEPSYTIENARLTVSIMTQSSALDRFLKKTKDDVRGNGFLSRFLVCFPPSNCGGRQTHGIVFTDEAVKAFNDRLNQLLEESAALEDYTSKRVVEFSDEAKSIWFDVYNDIESKMAPNGIYYPVKDHASKLCENIARLAALLQSFDRSSDDDITVETLIAAINLMGYFSSHFMAVFNAPPKYIIDEQNLLYWFANYRARGVRYLKRNKILQCGPIGTRNKKDLDTTLANMQANNQIQEIIISNARIIDLFPEVYFDQVKLNNDIGLRVF
ncbi:YfjI family protein [Shewanella sp. TB4-MNA-CIBAN-0142]|uniref:YfjI family protein n=1 Tax=Shewanella sp. TB4-MNA-CIBAN-0142 TaxID=3140464 RepID=UPI003322E98C